MNKIKKLIILLTLFFCGGLTAQSTFSVGEFNPYFSEFLKPMSLGIATGMGHGWSHDAKPHSTLGFDVSFNATIVQFPSGELTFDHGALSSMYDNDYKLMQGGKDVSSSAMGIPTIASDEVSDYSLQKKLSNNYGSALTNFDLLDGVDIPFVPNLAIQAAVGLPKGTEVMVRFVPDMSNSINDLVGDDDVFVNKLNMWGVGVKHDFKQWIPVLSRIPIIQLSAMMAYSQFNFDINTESLTLDPEDIIINNTMPITYETNADPVSNPGVWDSHGFDMTMSSLVGSILIGANIPVFKPYIGVGFNRASLNSGITGNLPKITINGNKVSVGIDDKCIRIKESRTFANFQAGFNINLAIFNIFAQYTLQEYSMFSGGIAFGFR